MTEEMDGLEKLERTQKTIHSLSSVGVFESNPPSQRFLADFTCFLMNPCDELDIASKCQLISKHMPKISTLLIRDELQGEDSTIVENTLELYGADEAKRDYVQRFHDGDVALIGVDSMIRSNSTLEDFCRSYFMFHGMEANQPQSIFRYLPLLSFAESYIYQLDGLNEKLVQFPGDGALDTHTRIFSNDPFRPLLKVLEDRGILSERITEELNCGEEYWSLERKLCHALMSNMEISIEDAKRAIHLKSFDYRVLNLLLYQLRGEEVNALHMEFLSISELLVEVSDDLFDYEDDVADNNFNILRMFVKYYGAYEAPLMMAKFISEAEEKYDEISKGLDPQLWTKYQKRCQEATKGGGKKCGPPLGTWYIPQVIKDETQYRKSLFSNYSNHS